MPTRTALQKSLVGPAGEHFVLFRLYQQGMLASLLPSGAPTADVSVLAADESVVATLQVKTRTAGDDKGWPMNAKHEHIRAPRCFYAFVDMEVPKDTMPITYIIPSSEVAKMLVASHKAWLSIPHHHDTPMRRVKSTHPFEVPGYPDGWMEQYRESWDRLKSVVEQNREPLNNGELGTRYLPGLLPTPPGT
jgi:hypothetical protein